MKSDISIVKVLMRKPILHVLSMLRMSESSYLNYLLPQEMFQRLDLAVSELRSLFFETFSKAYFSTYRKVNSTQIQFPPEILCPYISNIICLARPFSVILIMYTDSFTLNVMTGTREGTAVNSYMRLACICIFV